MAERFAAPSKAQLRQWKGLMTEKCRRREGLFLAEGAKVVTELLRSGRPAEAVLVSGGRSERLKEILSAIPAGMPIFRLTDRDWNTLSQDPSPEGVMAVAIAPPPADPSARVAAETGPLLLLDRVNNPNNLGALLRTAHWFGFRTVLVSQGSCEVTNPKVVRALMGSLFHLAVIGGLDFNGVLAQIRGRFRIVGSEVRDGMAPHPCGPATALLMGSESHGLSEDLLAQTHERWRIPGGEGAESLSLPQAAAIMMYECMRKVE